MGHEAETSLDAMTSDAEHRGNMPIPESMSARATTMAGLRAIAAGAGGQRGGGDAVPFGSPAVDLLLAGGGLARDALHETAAASVGFAEEAAATLFLAGAAARFAAGPSACVLWATIRFDLYAPGLDQVGLTASKLIHAEARDDAEVLALLEDAVRDGSPAAVVGEVRRAGMVATRRLQLAAGERGVPVLLHRRWRRIGVDPLAEPSAAATRWRIGCAPSPPTAVGIARARWTVELVRQRGGAPFSLLLEACDHEGRLAVPAPAADRTPPAAGAVRRRAA